MTSRDNRGWIALTVLGFAVLIVLPWAIGIAEILTHVSIVWR